MSADALELSWLTDDLAVGGALPPAAAAARHLSRRLRIRSVVDVRLEGGSGDALARHGVERLHLPLPALVAAPQELLDAGTAWALARLARGDKVLVHGERGVGRSALVCLCVLVACGRRPLDALVAAKRARARIAPTLPQLETFRAFCARRGERPPPLHELAHVASSHLRAERPEERP